MFIGLHLYIFFPLDFRSFIKQGLKFNIHVVLRIDWDTIIGLGVFEIVILHGYL